MFLLCNTYTSSVFPIPFGVEAEITFMYEDVIGCNKEIFPATEVGKIIKLEQKMPQLLKYYDLNPGIKPCSVIVLKQTKGEIEIPVNKIISVSWKA